MASGSDCFHWISRQVSHNEQPPKLLYFLCQTLNPRTDAVNLLTITGPIDGVPEKEINIPSSSTDCLRLKFVSFKCQHNDHTHALRFSAREGTNANATHYTTTKEEGKVENVVRSVWQKPYKGH